ncbi:MAG: response regulator transcription factor [Saprospiraceae bacterium]|nr:response regulator transcription factor [Saprospiraceae bacterium]
MKAHILYVEDDESLGFVTKDNLELEDYKVTHCLNGQDAINTIETEKFDLIILDVMLPDVDGFTIAKKIREQDIQTPIIFLTAKSLKEDKIHGLKIGADDYITKPFSIEELTLKIDVFLRRSKGFSQTPNGYLSIGEYRFSYHNLDLSFNDGTRRLTQREADLLKYLIINKNKVLKRGEILEAIWGRDDYFLGRSLDVFISRLRKYLDEDKAIQIENIHGVGFKFSSP